MPQLNSNHKIGPIPEPVGPIKRTLLFSSSTESSSTSDVPDSAPDLVVKCTSLVLSKEQKPAA